MALHVCLCLCGQDIEAERDVYAEAELKVYDKAERDVYVEQET